MTNNLITDILEIDNRQVAILGSGVSGRACKKLLDRKRVNAELFDQHNRVFTDNDAQSSSLVVQSPGFSPDHEWIKRARDHGKKVFSEVDLGLNWSNHSEFIAVTGTNGKTSLTSILGHVCKNLNLYNIEAGNIGRPLSDAVSSEHTSSKIIFHETSSFQASSSETIYPDTVLWTNFAADHLDYHGTEKEYFLAKLKLANNCKSPNNVFIGSSVREYARKYGLIINQEFVEIKPLDRCDLPEGIDMFHQSIPQLENLAFALNWLRLKGVTKKKFFYALKGYSPHPYRLQKITEINDVSFWNDSKSTNLASTHAACQSFDHKVIWIGGGKQKGEELSEFSEYLFPYLHRAFLFGDSAKGLSEFFNSRGIKFEICKSLKEAIHRAYNSAKRYTDILFSPGFASFDMFSDYLDRGNCFDSLVFDLKSAVQVTTKININNLQASH